MMPEPAQTSDQCPDCREDLEHCHGTAIVHVDGAADCSDDPGCRRPATLHLFMISCADTDCDCLPGPVAEATQARAS
jgi:hypothetical protein